MAGQSHTSTRRPAWKSRCCPVCRPNVDLEGVLEAHRPTLASVWDRDRDRVRVRVRDRVCVWVFVPIPACGRIGMVDGRWWGSDDNEGSLRHLQSRRDGMV